MTGDSTVKGLLVAVVVAAGLVLSLGVLGIGPLGGLFQDPAEKMTVGNVTVDEGETATADVTLETVPAGFAGFQFFLTVEDPSVATIENATANDEFGFMTQSPEIAEDGESAEYVGADIEENVGEGAGPFVLGTVTVEGQSEGHTCLRVSDEPISDGSGESIPVTVEGGFVSVGGATGSC